MHATLARNETKHRYIHMEDKLSTHLVLLINIFFKVSLKQKRLLRIKDNINYRLGDDCFRVWIYHNVERPLMESNIWFEVAIENYTRL